MAREPQRAEQPHHLDAKLIPLERALLARAAVLDEESRDEAEAALGGAVKLLVSQEFRGLANELHHW